MYNTEISYMYRFILSRLCMLLFMNRQGSFHLSTALRFKEPEREKTKDRPKE